MSTQYAKVSLTWPSPLLERIRGRVGTRGVSRYVAQALGHKSAGRRCGLGLPTKTLSTGLSRPRQSKRCGDSGSTPSEPPARRRGPRTAVLLDAEGLSAGAQGDARARARPPWPSSWGLGARQQRHVGRGPSRPATRRSSALAVVGSGNSRDPDLGRAAGELLGRTGRDDTVDAVVAVTAQSVGRLVRLLTGDPADLRALTADMPGVSGSADRARRNSILSQARQPPPGACDARKALPRRLPAL